MSMRRLTEAERRQWGRDGYLVVKGALTPDDVDRCIQAVDDLYARYVGPINDGGPQRGMGRRNIYAENDVFIDMIDHPGTFGLVLDLMGSYIGCSVAQVTMRTLDPSYKGYIHPDGGEALEQIRVTESSLPLQVKIQYFLTPLPEPNMGNFIVFPGSHLRPWPEERLPAGTDTPGGVPLCVEAGDAVIFPHALWHGPGPNLSDQIRKTLIYRYSQLFMQPWDFDKADAGATGAVYAAPTAALGGRGRLAPRHLLPQPQPRGPGRPHGGHRRAGGRRGGQPQGLPLQPH